MITAKFGGTAVTPRNLHCLKEIVGQKHGCVVVSAIGKESADDVKVTDLLKAYYRGDEKAWQAVECKYKRLALVNGIDEDVEKLLFDAKKRSLCNGADYCLSLGEELAAKLVASFLKVPYIEAEKCIVFGKNSLDVKRTFAICKTVSAVCRWRLWVVSTADAKGQEGLFPRRRGRYGKHLRRGIAQHAVRKLDGRQRRVRGKSSSCANAKNDKQFELP